MSRPTTSPSRPRAFAGRAGVRRVLAALAVPVLLLTVRPLAAQADGGLQVVTVHRTPQGVSAVVGVDPAPLAALPKDAAVVTPAASGSSPQPSATIPPATTSPVVDITAGTPVALVVDASSTGAAARDQTLSGTAGLLLRLPSVTPVVVVADGSPPRLLTSDGARQAEGINALTTLSSTPAPSSGGTSTPAALDLAVQHLPRASTGGRVVVLTTSQPPPVGADAQRLVDRLITAGVVLGVVGTGSAGTSWQDVANGTGGAAVAAVPTDSSSAYDSLLATLQGRYVVRFAPPAGVEQVSLAITSAGQRLTTALAVPGATGSSAAPSTAPSPAAEQTSSSVPWGILVGLAVLAVLLVGGVLLLRRRGRSTDDGPAPVETSAALVPGRRGVDPVTDIAALPGVELYDITNPEQPTKIPAPEPAALDARPGRPELVRISPPPVLPAGTTSDEREAGDVEPERASEPEPTAEAEPVEAERT
ncbi:MAG TPA: hypothetical protein VEV65_06295, partial [Kineosporiaceae bacterium]|nr:hypothetical protein [Kineosporiaceae bacterium]